MATPVRKPAPAKPAGVKTQVHQAAKPAARPAQRTAVTAPRKTAATTRPQDLPAHIKTQSRGSENVEMGDVVIPRIELVQALSPCLDKNDAGFIPGAEQGMLFNSVTRQLYGESVVVCPVFFRKQWLVWKDRKSKGGGGFGGAFDTPSEADSRIAEEENAEDWDKQETAQQIVLVVDQDTGETAEAVISMSRTKLKVSRQWNSLIRINGFDRFSRIYSVFGVDDQNANGDKYKNLGVALVEFAPKDVYDQAEALYEAISVGTRKVKVDDKYDEDVIDGQAEQALAGEY